jgi:hypothetical protein
MDGMKKAAKLEALKEILTMIGDMETEPFGPKPEVKAMKVGILTKKPLGQEMDMPEGMDEGDKEEKEPAVELEASGGDIEEIKRKLMALLK